MGIIDIADKVIIFGAVLLEQGVGREVCCVPSSGQYDGSVLSVLVYKLDRGRYRDAYMLTVLLVVDADHLVALLEQLRDLCFFENLDPIRSALSEILKLQVSLGSRHRGIG